jgi:serine/threonine protein kinase
MCVCERESACACVRELTHDSPPHMCDTRVYVCAQVIDDTNNDKLYLVLEYVKGGQVAEWDAESKMYAVPAGPYAGGPVREEDAREYIRNTIMGLDYLHLHSIIHRDIKPENLLKTEEGVCKVRCVYIYVCACDC